MQSIKDLCERVEQHFGDALLARDETCKRLSRQEGIGPPDLCWVRKYATTSFGYRSGEPQGYYHWVVGLEVSSPATIAAYFAQLISRQESPTLLQGMLQTHEWHIDGAIYCCYDAFHRVDIRCKLTLPGTVEVQAVDGQGNLLEASDLMWHGTHVSSFLRAMLLDPASLQQLRTCRVQPFAPAPADERRFVDSLQRLFQAGLLPGQLPWLRSWDEGEGSHPEDMDVLGSALVYFYRRRQRLPQAARTFEALRPYWPEAAVYLAYVSRTLGDPGAAVRQLRGALDEAGASLQLLVSLGQAVLESGDPWLGFVCATEALELERELRPAWMLAARSLVRLRRYMEAMKALNRVPPPPFSDLPVTSRVLCGPLPQEYDITAPKQQAPNVEEKLGDILEGETSQPTSDSIDDLPGERYMPLDPPGSVHVCDTALGRTQVSVTGGIFAFVLDVIDETGWDYFLDIRSRTFRMSGDAADRGGGSGTASGTPRNNGGSRTIRSSEGHGWRTSAPGHEQHLDPDAVIEDFLRGLKTGSKSGPGGGGSGAATSVRHGSQSHGTLLEDPSLVPPPPGPAPRSSWLDRPGPGREEAEPKPSDFGAAAEKMLDELDGDKLYHLAIQEECSEWLDDIIVAIYQDLRQHRDFLEQEAALKKRAGAEANGEGEGTADGDSDDDPPATFTAVDWMSIGLLCERINEEADAERAHRVVTHQRPCVVSSLCLARTYAKKGWVQDCLTHLTAVIQALKLREPGAPSSGKPGAVVVPQAVESVFFTLVVHSGLQAVKEYLDANSQASSVLSDLLSLSITWHTEGYDK